MGKSFRSDKQVGADKVGGDGAEQRMCVKNDRQANLDCEIEIGLPEDRNDRCPIDHLWCWIDNNVRWDHQRNDLSAGQLGAGVVVQLQTASDGDCGTAKSIGDSITREGEGRCNAT